MAPPIFYTYLGPKFYSWSLTYVYPSYFPPLVTQNHFLVCSVPFAAPETAAVFKEIPFPVSNQGCGHFIKKIAGFVAATAAAAGLAAVPPRRFVFGSDLSKQSAKKRKLQIQLFF
jgi:hypothetical protein